VRGGKLRQVRSNFLGEQTGFAMTDQIDGYTQSSFAPPEPPRQMPRLQSQREAEDQALAPQAGPVNQLRYIPYNPSPFGLSDALATAKVTSTPTGFRGHPWWHIGVVAILLIGGGLAAKQVFFSNADEPAAPQSVATGANQETQPSTTLGAATTVPEQPQTSTPNTVPLGALDPAALRHIQAPTPGSTILVGRNSGWTMSIPTTWFQTDPQGVDTRFVLSAPNGRVETISIWMQPTSTGETMQAAAASLGKQSQNAIGDATPVSSEVIVTATGGYAIRVENIANSGTMRWIDYAVLNDSRMVIASFSTAATADPEFIAAVETILATLEQPTLPVFGTDETSTGEHIKVELPAMVSSPLLTINEMAQLSVPPAPTDGISYFDANGYALTIGPQWQRLDTKEGKPASWMFCCQDKASAGIASIQSFPSQFDDIAGSLSLMEVGLRLVDESIVIIQSGVIYLPDGRQLARVVGEDASQGLRYEGWLVVKDGIGTYVAIVIPADLWAEYGPQLESYLGTLTRP
jgi:hypothetical protein